MANQPIITLWKKTSQRGSGDYFDGVMKDNQKVIGFYNSHKKNPQEPDLRIYPRLEDGKMGTEVASLWCNVSEKSGKKYLAGYVFLEGDNKEKVTGFIQESKNPKYPYLKIYLQSELDSKKEVKKEEVKKSEPKKESKEPKKEKLPF